MTRGDFVNGLRRHWRAIVLSVSVLLAGAPLTVTAGKLAADGGDLYRSSCAGCHGQDGAKLPTVKLMDSGYLTTLGDETLVKAIAEGKGKMPPQGSANGGKLSDEDIQAIMGFLKSQSEAATSAQSAAVETTLALTSSRENAVGEPLTLTAHLQTKDGAPVDGEVITFYQEGELLGIKAPMEIGEARTNAEGNAAITYLPRVIGDQQLIARHDGGTSYTSAEATASGRVYVAEPAYVPDARGLEFSGAGPWIVKGTMAIVWATMLFGAFQGYRVWASG